jgi:aminotransferase
MPITLSRQQQILHQSAIRYMSIACARSGGIIMAQGICDLDIPAEVAEGARQAIEDGFNIYTAADGTAALKQAIAVKYERHYDIVVEPEEEVLVSAGATGAFYAAMLAILDPGDEVILFSTYFGYHKITLESLGCRLKYVNISLEDHTVDFAGLQKALSPRTKVVVINNPLNPSGSTSGWCNQRSCSH